MSNLNEITRLEMFSALEPSDLGYDATAMELAGLDWTDFVDIDSL